MKGKIVVITGASSGIGFETARHLAALGGHIVMVCRDPERGSAARAKIAESAAEAAPDLVFADLSSQASIRAAADQIRSKNGRIDVLINNAGAIFARRELTLDGIEKTLAVNHLAPFLLTRLLFDLVVSAGAGRVITVSSEIHSGALDFENLQGERGYNFLAAYYQSKLENILFTYELARRAETTGVTVNTLSPGPTRTRFGDNMQGLPALFPLVMKRIPFLFTGPARGARTSVYLASSPEVASISGRFFMNNREMRTKPVSYDIEVARRLWEISEDMTGGDWQPAVASHEWLTLGRRAPVDEGSR
jgi:NAD(P)-dependent dehydrogenase (short-subunit alcohol dehydrogenase family)